jgi:hypothetical protein
VVDDSAAWFAGLESGDVLTAIDGESVASSEDVVGAIASREPGTMVDLAWQRGGEAHSARVRLGRRDVPPFGNSMLFAPMPGSEQGELGLLPPRDRPGNQAWPRSLRNRLRQVLPRFGQGQGPGAGPRWQDDRDQDLDQDLDFDDEDADFGASGPQGLRGWLQQLEDHLRDLHVDADLDLDDAHDVRITLEDGKLTIDKDGQSSTYDLPAPHEQPAPDGAVQQDAQRLAPLEHALQAALVNLLAPSTAAAAPGGCGGTCPLATSPAAGTATTAAAMKMQRQQAGAAEAPADCGGACPHSASAGAGTSCPMKAKDQVQAGAGTTAPAPLADQVPSGQDL